MERENGRFNNCVGPSMYPTLRSGDGIILEPFKSEANLKVGDIILYSRSDGLSDIVHRIIRIEKDGVITRGDNNNRIDPGTVPFSNIIGKVISAKRGDKTVRIYSGTPGMAVHRLMLLRMYLRPAVLYIPRIVINLIADLRLFFFVHRFINIKIIHIKRDGTDGKLLYYKNRVIGKTIEGPDKWKIFLPYNIFIDTRKLK